MKLVEVVVALNTAEETVACAEQLATAIGKQPIRITLTIQGLKKKPSRAETSWPLHRSSAKTSAKIGGAQVLDRLPVAPAWTDR
jgi:3-hydroxyacyl-CoA dehydrogenase, NAD binding domain